MQTCNSAAKSVNFQEPQQQTSLEILQSSASSKDLGKQIPIWRDSDSVQSFLSVLLKAFSIAAV